METIEENTQRFSQQTKHLFSIFRLLKDNSQILEKCKDFNYENIQRELLNKERFPKQSWNAFISNILKLPNNDVGACLKHKNNWSANYKMNDNNWQEVLYSMIDHDKQKTTKICKTYRIRPSNEQRNLFRQFLT